jgi:hypothetical protein
MATPGELIEQIAKLAETVQPHDSEINIISRALQQMIEKPITRQKRVGFHSTRDVD